MEDPYERESKVGVIIVNKSGLILKSTEETSSHTEDKLEGKVPQILS